MLAGAHIGGAEAAQVYSQNFESGSAGVEWSGGGSVQTSAGFGAFGFGELHLRNEGSSASALTLSNLAAHSELTFTFSLAM